MGGSPLPFAVDEARLAPPILREASVRKSDAIAKLRASSSPLVVIVAPAGYGKTTLLGHWAKDDPRPIGWVSLDEHDNDPLVLLRDFATAVHRAHPLAPSVFDGLSGQGESIWSRVVPVGNALAAIRHPIVMALDDLHSVTNPACLQVLAELVNYVPPRSQVVIASREAPSLPIARWRARGMLVEIGQADLRLNHQEADSLLKGASVALSEPEVIQLTNQTEGWPAGLYLAALSIRSGAPDLSHNRAFSGDDRYISEYFRLEVMSRMPRREAQFMTRTSVLDTMNGALCDALLETTGSAQTLESLERSNRFVVPLDNRGEHYRYHHLFRQLLRAELERNEPEAVPDFNRRAMAWYSDNGQPEAAVPFGQAARATEAVAQLVDGLALPIYYDGRIDTLDTMLRWFDDADMRRFPAIAVLAAWAHLLSGRAVEAERYRGLAEGGNSAIPLSHGSQTIEPMVAVLRAYMMPVGVRAALADADVAVAQLASGSGWQPDARTIRGIAHVLLGSIDLARDDFLQAVDQERGTAGADRHFVAEAEVALLEAGQGAWFEAARHAELARAIVDRGRFGHYVAAALAHVAVARVAVHGHRHAEARTAMLSAHRLRPLMSDGLPWLSVQVGIELTRAHLALGEAEAARAILAETTAVVRRRPDLGLLVDEVRELSGRVAAIADRGAWAVNLTAAELRLLPYLATHLTFPEIAGRLFISSHTVRSEAKAIYRKLDANSRGEAIDRAVDVGLLAPMFPYRVEVAV